MNRVLVFNAIKTPDGTILESNTVHDYKQYLDKNGKVYIIDGGLSYRRVSDNGDEVDLSVYSDMPHETIRNVAFRTGYGKPGNKDYGTYRITRIKDMDDDYLKASIDYVQKVIINYQDNVHYNILLN